MQLLGLYNRLAKWPFGRKIFSILFCFRAPYFGSIRPYFTELKPGLCKVRLRKRRAVLNHIGTVHAIAMCNLAEAAAGSCLEVSLKREWRWIPKGMTVRYLKKATTSVECVCDFKPDQLQVGDNQVTSNVYDLNGEKVFDAVIDMYISERKQK